ncbi:MAG TPA: trigger factor [Patescibacteria group bacterium]|nr:trigger factor [Patescibacteria group bacterium]
MKKLPKSQIEFELVVPWNTWEKYLDEAASEASKEIKIEGFRPGKAPRNLVEQKIGKGPLLNNASQKAVKKAYVDFIRQLADKEKIEAVGSPKIEITKLAEGNDLEFKAIVSVMPEIKIDPEYKKDIKKINEQYKNKPVDVKEDDVNLEIEKLANSRVKLVTVLREARKNDSVEIDFDVLRGGVPIENGKSKNHPLILGRGVFIPGFEDNIIGMKEGEEKEFELNFPDTYHKKDLAGKPAKFKVKVNLVQERQTPEINDEFAKSLGKFNTLEDLKKSVKEGLEHEQGHAQKDKKREEYIEAIIKNSEVELPEILVHEEVHRMLDEFSYQTQMMGMTIDAYLDKIGKKKAELEHDWEPQAQKRVKSALAMKEIVKTEDIKAESKEIEEEMNKTLASYKKVKDMEKNIDTARLYNYCKSLLENEKVFEFLEKI